jgi:hypothetical protein
MLSPVETCNPYHFHRRHPGPLRKAESRDRIGAKRSLVTSVRHHLGMAGEIERKQQLRVSGMGRRDFAILGRLIFRISLASDGGSDREVEPATAFGHCGFFRPIVVACRNSFNASFYATSLVTMRANAIEILWAKLASCRRWGLVIIL